MAPKRKADATDATASDPTVGSGDNTGSTATSGTLVEKAPPAKKRKSAAGDAAPLYQSWRDVKIDGEDEGEVAIYDDCNDIRRKITALSKEPGFKITHWLRDDLGGVNSNSYGRFMKAKGPQGGAENGTYEAAYIYFEKRRIFEGKKKSAKRIRNEQERPGGLPRRDGGHPVWTFVGK